MKEIKRYNEDVIYQKYNREEFYAGMVCEDDGTWMEYSVHKAVVEKDNILIGNYLKTIKEDNEKFKELYKRIEGLEAETLDYRYKLGLRGGVETKFDN